VRSLPNNLLGNLYIAARLLRKMYLSLCSFQPLCIFNVWVSEHIKRSYLVVAARRILRERPGVNVFNKQSPNNKNLSTTFEFG